MTITTRAPEHTCLGLTEQGKMLALAGKHKDALAHYREALRIAMTCEENEVFFHYVTQCILESLELSNAFGEVRDYCTRAEEQFATVENSDPLLAKQRATNLERLGLCLIQLDEVDDGRIALENALNLVEEKSLPLAVKILGWLRRGLTVETRQLRMAQKQFGYFMVRSDQIRKEIAIPLPKGAGAPAIFG
jgi:tetratricopeptide (TPR) repeat protein